MLLPWKTASQTISARLQKVDQSPYSKFFHFNPHLESVVHQHLTADEFVRLPESKKGYLLASFVRNPYDRVFSGFRQLQKDILEQPPLDYPEPWIRDLVNKQLAQNHAQLRQANFQFDDWFDLITEEQIYEVGKNTNFPLHPSHNWTHVKGKKLVSFVGYVENFELDFQRFLNLVNIKKTEKININVIDLKGTAQNNPFGYRYLNNMSKRSIDKINYIFEKDFDLFGYEKVFV